MNTASRAYAKSLIFQGKRAPSSEIVRVLIPGGGEGGEGKSSSIQIEDNKTEAPPLHDSQPLSVLTSFFFLEKENKKGTHRRWGIGTAKSLFNVLELSERM